MVLFVCILKLLRKSGSEFFSRLRKGVKERTGLETYRKTLEDKTLRISHPWMKEDQTLTDIRKDENYKFQITMTKIYKNK